MNGLILRKSKNGNGVFANRDFRKGEFVLEFEGTFFSKNQLPKLYSCVADHYLQIGKDLYMGPSGKKDDYVNHSCEPNCGIRMENHRVFLMSIQVIPKGDEITFDYSTTMDEYDWEMECHCGSKYCRGIVKDFQFLPREWKQKYIRLKVVPNYLLKSFH